MDSGIVFRSPLRVLTYVLMMWTCASLHPTAVITRTKNDIRLHRKDNADH